MPCLIAVDQGPDQGKELSVREQLAVRIGNDPVADLCLSDPNVRGYITVQARQGAYEVVNKLDGPITLDGATLARRASQVWPEGAELRLTDQTTLILTTDAAADSAHSTDLSRILTIVVIIICLPLGLYLMMRPSTDKARAKPENSREEFNELVNQLRLIRPAPDHLIESLRTARSLELRGDKAGARADYYKARDELQNSNESLKREIKKAEEAKINSKANDLRGLVKRTEDFLNARLLDLN